MKKGYYLFLIIVSFITLHLAFLFGDPQIPFDFSRGAWTDEGLYLFQMRNFFLTSQLELNVSDGFLKAPLYNFIAAPVVMLNQLWCIRLFMLIFLSLAIGTYLQKKGISEYFIFLVLALQSTFFFHAHLAMAEVCIASLILYLLSLIASDQSAKDLRKMVFIIACIPAIKIQYAYYLLSLLYPLIILARKKELFKWKSILSLSPLIGLGLLVIVNLNEYSFILNQQEAGKFQSHGHLLFRVKVNLINILESKFNVALLLCFGFSNLLLISKWKLLKSTEKSTAITLWILLFLESHKLLMIYLPQRYLIIWFMLLILSSAHQISTIIVTNGTPKRLLIGVSILSLFIFQAYHIPRQTFQMNKSRSQLRTLLPKKATLIGPWAPSLSWGTQWVSYPAWKGYYENEQYQLSNGNTYLLREEDNKDNDLLFEGQSQKETLDSFSIQTWNLVIEQF